nr:hypothetical protein BaRGS_014045 [Batillaria attramentaria]
MGLRYLPGLPLPNLSKPLPELALPLGYPKSLSDGLASAFRSTRPPFIHPAAAAYYSSLRNSMPYPFAFSPPGGDGPCKSVGEEHQPPQGVERLEMLKALHKSSLDPMAAFQPPVPHSAAPTSIQAGHGVNTAAILSPRSVSSSSSSPMTQSSPVRPSEVSDLPPRVGLSAGLGVPGVTVGLEGRIGVGVVKRAKEHEPVRYQCEACSKSYSTFSGLSKHKQFHCAAQVKKEFSCKYCDKTYVSLGALKMHIRTHTLPCKCTVCGKAFSRPWLLQGHVRTHTGEKPFTCPHCARAFADRSNLRAHLQTHSDVKKYSCRACSKTFSRMSLLLKHEDGCCPSMV